MPHTTKEERTTTDEDLRAAFVKASAASARSLGVRQANPERYWAHAYGRTHYYWDDVRVSREEFVAAVGGIWP